MRTVKGPRLTGHKEKVCFIDIITRKGRHGEKCKTTKEGNCTKVKRTEQVEDSRKGGGRGDLLHKRISLSSMSKYFLG